MSACESHGLNWSWTDSVNSMASHRRLLHSSLLLLLILTGTAEILKAAKGSSVHLPCPLDFPSYEKLSVTWTKSTDPKFQCSYHKTHNKTATKVCSAKMETSSQPLGLNVTDVRSGDSGVYNCTVSRIIPPPHIEKICVTELHVTEPPGVVLESQNTSDPLCIRLLCALEGLDPQEGNFSWGRRSRGSPEWLLADHGSSGANASLALCQPEWVEGDTFTCNVSHSATASAFSDSVKIPCCQTGWESTETIQRPFPTFIVAGLSVSAGVVALTTVIILVYIGRRRTKAAQGSIVYNNQVYENFSFSKQALELTNKAMQEQCVYEN